MHFTLMILLICGPISAIIATKLLGALHYYRYIFYFIYLNKKFTIPKIVFYIFLHRLE